MQRLFGRVIRVAAYCSTQGDFDTPHPQQFCHATLTYSFIDKPRDFGVLYNRVNCGADSTNLAKGGKQTESSEENLEFIKTHFFGKDSPWSEVVPSCELSVHDGVWITTTDWKKHGLGEWSKGKRALFCNFLIALRTCFEYPQRFENTKFLVSKGVPFRRAVWSAPFFDGLCLETIHGTISGGRYNSYTGHWFLRADSSSFFFGNQPSTNGEGFRGGSFDALLWPSVATGYGSDKLQSVLSKFSNNYYGGRQPSYTVVQGRFGSHRIIRETPEQEIKKDGLTVADVVELLIGYKE